MSVEFNVTFEENSQTFDADVEESTQTFDTSLSEQINIESGVKDVLVDGTSVVDSNKKAQINGFASKTWVEAKGYLTDHKTFIATYGTTTAAEIAAAVTAGKAIFCNYTDGGVTHQLMLVDATDGKYGFAESTVGTNSGITSVSGIVASLARDTDTWSVSSGSSSIPTKTSDLTNDSGFLTEHQSLSAYRTSSAQDTIDDALSNKLTTIPASSSDAGKIAKAKTILDGKVSEWELGEDSIIRGTTAPTTSTAGSVGSLYGNTADGSLYVCTAVSGSTYTWKEVMNYSDFWNKLTEDENFDDPDYPVWDADQVSYDIENTVKDMIEDLVDDKIDRDEVVLKIGYDNATLIENESGTTMSADDVSYEEGTVADKFESLDDDISDLDSTIDSYLENVPSLGYDVRVSAPSSSSDTGLQGQTAYDTDYFYICVADNTWKRIALSTF